MREDYAPGKPVIAGNSQAGSLAWEWSGGGWLILCDLSIVSIRRLWWAVVGSNH